MTAANKARWETHNEDGLRRFAAGDLVGAESSFATAIREAERLGETELGLAASLGNLGQLKYKQKDYGAAEPLFRRSLTIRERVLGAEHPGVVQSISNLAALYYARDDLAQAEPLFRRALAVTELHRPPNHGDVATCLNNLARVCLRKNDRTGAASLLVRLLAVREETLGPMHLEVAAVLGNLAAVRFAEGAYPGAERLSRRALSIHEANLPPADPALIAARAALTRIQQRGQPSAVDVADTAGPSAIATVPDVVADSPRPVLDAIGGPRASEARPTTDRATKWRANEAGTRAVPPPPQRSAAPKPAPRSPGRPAPVGVVERRSSKPSRREHTAPRASPRRKRGGLRVVLALGSVAAVLVAVGQADLSHRVGEQAWSRVTERVIARSEAAQRIATSTSDSTGSVSTSAPAALAPRSRSDSLAWVDSIARADSIAEVDSIDRAEGGAKSIGIRLQDAADSLTFLAIPKVELRGSGVDTITRVIERREKARIDSLARTVKVAAPQFSRP